MDIQENCYRDYTIGPYSRSILYIFLRLLMNDKSHEVGAC